jgi:hypothetical protein
MAAAIVQHTPAGRSASSGGTPNTVAFAYGSAVAAGNFLFIMLAVANASGVSGVTDSLGQTWSKAVSKAGSGLGCELWYKENTGAGTPIVTVTLATTLAVNVTAELGEASGVVTSGSLDQTASAASAFSSALSTGTTAVPAMANELWLMACAIGNESGTVTAGPVSASTLDNQLLGTTSLLAAYQNISDGTAGAGTSWTNSTNVGWAGVVATFKVPIVAAGMPRRAKIRHPKATSRKKRARPGRPSAGAALMLFAAVPARPVRQRIAVRAVAPIRRVLRRILGQTIAPPAPPATEIIELSARVHQIAEFDAEVTAVVEFHVSISKIAEFDAEVR